MKQGIKITLTLLIPLVIGLTSCLKDVKSPTDPGGSNNVVEFQNSSIPVSYTSIYYQYANSVLFPSTGLDTGGFNVNVNYAGAVFAAPQDITVTLAIDTAALSAFNASESSNYIVAPTDVFSFPSTITIPKGQNLGQIRVTITKAADFDFNAQYALPLTITTSSYGIVSTNFGTVMYTYVGRNKYDGLYSLDQQQVGWGAYGISDGPTYTWPSNISFLTTGATTNTINTTEEDYYQPAFTTGGGTTGFGATQTQFVFDGATDKLINVVNLQPNDGRGRAFMLNPAITTSRYDATGSTPMIYAAYIMVQNGRPSQYFYDTLTYQGPRP